TNGRREPTGDGVLPQTSYAKAQRRTTMHRTEAQPYFQPIGERNRFLPEGPRAMRRQSREGIAWVNIQCSPDSTSGSLFFYDPKESQEEGEQLVFDYRLDCPSRPGFLLPIEGGDRVLVGLEKALQVCDL